MKEGLTRDEALKQYELCQQAAQSLETSIWQSTSLVGVGSVGTLILVASLPHPESVALPTTILVITATLAWWSIARMWWSIQHTKFTTMLEIEQELHIAGQVSVIRYLDDIKDLLRIRMRHEDTSLQPGARVPRRRYHIPPTLARNLHAFNWPNYQRSGPREVLPIFLRVNLSMWLVYLAWTMINAAA